MKNRSLPKRHNRRPRLDSSVYGPSGYAVHLIMGTYRRRPYFAQDPELGQMVTQTLREAASQQKVQLYCYCLMPDHLHLVAGVKPNGLHLQRFVSCFKAELTRARGSGAPRLWQRSFYDHVLRAAEDLGDLCRYVVDNPVRKGLARRWEDYPFAWLSSEV